MQGVGFRPYVYVLAKANAIKGCVSNTNDGVHIKFNATDDCIFLGFQNQNIMPAVYRLADIFVLPSQGPGETWGLAINEALGCGVPVIASNKCGGAIDLLESSNGLIINTSSDFDQLTQWVKDFKSDENLFWITLKVHSYQTIIDAVNSQIQ